MLQQPIECRHHCCCSDHCRPVRREGDCPESLELVAWALAHLALRVATLVVVADRALSVAMFGIGISPRPIRTSQPVGVLGIRLALQHGRQRWVRGFQRLPHRRYLGVPFLSRPRPTLQAFVVGPQSVTSALTILLLTLPTMACLPVGQRAHQDKPQSHEPANQTNQPELVQVVRPTPHDGSDGIQHDQEQPRKGKADGYHSE